MRLSFRINKLCGAGLDCKHAELIFIDTLNSIPLQGLVCGCLVHLIFFEILNRERDRKAYTMPHSRAIGFLQFVSLGVGLLAMGVLTTLTHEHNGHHIDGFPAEHIIPTTVNTTILWTIVKASFSWPLKDLWVIKECLERGSHNSADGMLKWNAICEVNNSSGGIALSSTKNGWQSDAIFIITILLL